MRIIDTCITNVGEDPLGRVSGGYMVISAYTLALENKPRVTEVYDPKADDRNIAYLFSSAALMAEAKDKAYFGEAHFDDGLGHLFGAGSGEEVPISCTALWVTEAYYD